MSVDYSVQALLNAEFSKNNILRIIDGAIKNKIIFYKHAIDAGQKEALKLEEIVHILDNNRKEEGAQISLLFEDEVHLLFVFSKDGLLELTLSLFTEPYNIKFENREYIDFARYIKLLLLLIDDFPIRHLETESD